MGCGAIHATLGLRRVCDREPRRRLSVWRKMIRDGGGEEGRRGRHLTNLNLFCQLPPTPSWNREMQRGLRERVPPWQAAQGGMRKESVVFGEEENHLAVWSEKHVEGKGGGRVSAELTALTISPIRCTSAMAGHHSVSHSNSHPNSPRPDLARNPRDFKFRGPFLGLDVPVSALPSQAFRNAAAIWHLSRRLAPLRAAGPLSSRPSHLPPHPAFLNRLWIFAEDI